MSVNAGISDIFFNTSLDDCWQDNWQDGDVFPGEYLRPKLLGKAQWLLDCLASFCAADLPTADELVDDFYSRL